MSLLGQFKFGIIYYTGKMHLPNLKQKYIKLLQPKMFIKANSNAKVEETDISTHLPQEF